MAYFYTSSIVEVCLKNSIKVEFAPTDLLGCRGHFFRLKGKNRR